MRYTKKSEKFINAYEWNRELPTKTFVQLGMNKLGELEDSEEEFGIDFITLFKTLKRRGAYIKRAFWPELGEYVEINDTEVVHLDFVPDEEGIDDAIMNSWVLVFTYYYYNQPQHLYVRVRDMDDTWSAI